MKSTNDLLKEAGYLAPFHKDKFKELDDCYELVPVGTPVEKGWELLDSSGWSPCICTVGRLLSSNWIHRRLKPGYERVKICE